MTEPVAVGKCVACGGEERGPTLESGSYRYALCAGCGHASLEPILDELAAKDVYSRAYFEGANSGGYLDYEADAVAHRRNARARLEIITRSLSQAVSAKRVRPSLLDVGCASGFLLEEARAAGFEIAGVDVSPWARERALARLGIEVAADLSIVVAAERLRFDAICLAQVLEHAPDPETMLTHAYRLLRPGGVLFIETWDRESAVARVFGRNWQQISPPSVAHLFSRRSLRSLLARHGFADVAIERGRKWVAIGFVGHLLSSKYGSIGRALRSVIERTHIGRLSLPYAFGDLITATAIRTSAPESAR